MAVNQPLHSSLKSAERANSKTEKRRESRVRFHGVAIREFARSLGDNPATDDGPPLGLSWEFWDVKRERKVFFRKGEKSSSSLEQKTGSPSYSEE